MPNSIAILNTTGDLVDDKTGLTKPGPMAVDGNFLWILARGSGLVHYDGNPSSSPPFSVGASPYDVAAAGGHAWVSERKPVVTWIRHVGSVTDPSETPSVTRRSIRVRQLKKAGAEAVGGGYLWVIPGPVGTGNRVALINLRNSHQRTVPVGLQTTAIAYDHGSAWVGTFDPRHGGTAYLTKVRPGSDHPPSYQLETEDGEGPLAVAVGAGSVWVITSRGNLLRFDPKTLKIIPIPMSREQPEWLAVGAGSVWTANLNHDNVSEIDPHTNKIVRTTAPLGRYDAVPCGIAATHAAVFVTFGETTCG